LNEQDKKVLEDVLNYVQVELVRLRNTTYQYRNSKKLNIAIEQKLLENTEIFSMMTEPVLRKLLEKKFALKWDYIAKLKCLSEDFIKKYFKGLSPTVILENYPDLSDETKELFYPYIGILTRLKMRVKMEETEEEIIKNYNKYGKKLRKKISNYINVNEKDLPDSLVLFTKLVR